MKRDAIKDELETIRKNHNGHLLPADVVEFARDPSTQLHTQFQWDDSRAAEQWRLQQARNIIRLHVTVIQEDTEPVRAYVSLTPDRHTGGGYRATVDVVNDDELRARMVADALKELRTFRRKYEQLKELRPVWEAIDAVEATEGS